MTELKRTIMLIISLILYLHFVSSSPLEPLKFIVYGPGLDSRIALPVRYLFVQLVDTSGNNVTSSRGSDVIRAYFGLKRNPSVGFPLRMEIDDLQDGSYVVRYRLFRSVYEDVQLTLYFMDEGGKPQPIAASPYQLPGPLYSEICHCPQRSLKDWLNRILQCPSNYKQLDEDLKNFPSINMTEAADIIYKHYDSPHSVALCHYKVKSNRIYRRCHGQHTGFKMFSDSALLSLARKTYLPDLDLIMNLGDWPLADRKHGIKAPVVSWCGSTETYDIVIPTYEVMEWVLEMMSRVSLDIFYVLENSLRDWSIKEDLAFWRGRDASNERLELVRLSLKHPRDLDARLTNMFFFPNDSSMGERAPYTPFTDFFRYRYLPSFDGTVAAYRLPLLLAGESLVLKQESPYYEHFYSDLEPGKHYMSLQRDGTDLMKLLTWARSHEDEARKIASEGRKFVRDRLLPEHILCYYGRVLEALGQRLVQPVVIPGDFELVEKSENDSEGEECRCDTSGTESKLREDL